MIKVSIIIATYNTADYIEECLESIIKQSLKPIEVIIVDDGSTDNTDEILKKYEKNYDYIRVFRQANAGQGVSINRALEYVNGEYIAFMDPDDKYPYEDSLEKLYNAAQVNNVLMCGGNILLNDNGIILSGYTAGDGDIKKTKNSIIPFNNYHFVYGHTRYLYDSRMMRKYNIKHGEYKRYGDQILTLSALYYAGYIYELDYPVYEYRINYKHNTYTEDVWLDVLKAYRDTIQLMISKEMRIMYKYNAFEEYKKICMWSYKWVDYSDEWNNVVDDIDSLLKGCDWEIINGETQKDIRAIKRETRKLIDIITKEAVIIYGAGENTKRFLKSYKTMCINIKGIAVTKEDHITELDSIQVRNLSFYKNINNVIVLITAGKRYWKEMEEYAYNLGFKKVEHIDMEYVSN